MTLSPVVVFIDLFDETCVPSDSANVRVAIEEQLKQQHKEIMNLRE
jgi:hypothetical protein